MEITRLRAHLRRYVSSEVFWILLVCIVALGVATYERSVRATSDRAAAEPTAMLFVGDVMLARHVETLMEVHGSYYPFTGVRDFFAEHQYVVGNFEGSIPENHARTPNGAMRFSVPQAAATVLARVGFTDLSLANNHALDYGRGGYEHTRAVLTDAGIVVAGDPQRVDAEEVLYRTIDGVVVGIIPLSAVSVWPSAEALERTVAEVSEKSDLQIAYVHWGTEYVPLAGNREQALAHTLVDLGVDAVIGHHPHVVQQVEEYRGAPIFYSLGNFVFDQYWNDAVREGLAISLTIANGEARYTLVPLSSEAARSVPVPMERPARAQFLDDIAARSDETLASAIRRGLIVESIPALASS